MALSERWDEEYYSPYAKENPEITQVPMEEPLPCRREFPRFDVDSRMRSRVLKVVLALTVTASIVTFRSGLNATRGYELVQTQQTASQLERENQQLELEIAKLKAPQRIKDIATNRLGMSVPREIYFSAGKQ